MDKAKIPNLEQLISTTHLNIEEKYEISNHEKKKTPNCFTL